MGETLTAESIMKAAKELAELAPDPLFRPGEIVCMNKLNIDNDSPLQKDRRRGK